MISWFKSIFFPIGETPQEKIESLRKRARQQALEMSNNFQLATRAYKAGDGAQAKRMSIKARQHEAKMKQLDKEAESLIYKLRNPDSDRAELEIDLHGLYVSEAVERAKAAVKKASAKRKTQLRIIVGKGIHSHGQVARIGPAIERLMVEQGLQCVADSRNSGVLIVDLVNPRSQWFSRLKWSLGLLLLVVFVFVKS